MVTRLTIASILAMVFGVVIAHPQTLDFQAMCATQSRKAYPNAVATHQRWRQEHSFLFNVDINQLLRGNIRRQTEHSSMAGCFRKLQASPWVGPTESLVLLLLT
jgi:hypothetical protein